MTRKKKVSKPEGETSCVFCRAKINILTDKIEAVLRSDRGSKSGYACKKCEKKMWGWMDEVQKVL